MSAELPDSLSPTDDSAAGYRMRALKSVACVWQSVKNGESRESSAVAALGVLTAALLSISAAIEQAGERRGRWGR